MPDVDRDGVRLHFEDTGEPAAGGPGPAGEAEPADRTGPTDEPAGPPLLLGHSFLCSGRMWDRQVGPLSERRRVVNADFRGHGLSGPATGPLDLHDLVDDQIAVLDRLGIERAVWVGLSIGGMVAMRAALAHPERVAALALFDTSARGETLPRKIRYRAMGLAARAAGLRPLVPTLVKLFFSEATRRSNPDLVAEWRTRFASMHVPSMLRFLDALLSREPIVDRLGEIEVPTLVVVGAEDPTTPPDLAEEIAAGIPDARLVVLPHAGHLSALERPDEANRALIDFLEDLR